MISDNVNVISACCFCLYVHDDQGPFSKKSNPRHTILLLTECLAMRPTAQAVSYHMFRNSAI